MRDIHHVAGHRERQAVLAADVTDDCRAVIEADTDGEPRLILQGTRAVPVLERRYRNCPLSGDLVVCLGNWPAILTG
jgi:hypothetical protein